MHRYFTFILFLFFASGAYAQDLSATMKMPESVEPGDVYVTEITINKGPINSYIKFSQKLPTNFKASEIDVKGGNFTFEDSIIKIVWFFPPANNEFTFSYKVRVPKDASGVKKIGGKIYYFFNTDREVFSFDKHFISIGKEKKDIVISSATKVVDNETSGNPTVKEINAALINATSNVTTDTAATIVVARDTIKKIAVPLEQYKDTVTNTLKTISVAPPLIAKDTTVVPMVGTQINSPVNNANTTTINDMIKVKDTTIIATVKPVIKVVEKDTIPAVVAVKKEEKIGDVDSSELIYSVQVGSYKEEVPLETANRFLQISAKAYKNLKENNGFTTFVVGNFKTKEDAVPLKNQMIEKGFKGAFVVAYPAKNVYTSIKNKSTKTNLSITDKVVVKNKSIVSAKKMDSKKSETLQPINNLTVSDSSAANKTYSVQIGAFKEEVPLETANKFLTLAAKGVKNLKNDLGLTIYTVGNFKTREEAVTFKNQLIEKGFKDAFVVAFQNGAVVK